LRARDGDSQARTGVVVQRRERDDDPDGPVRAGFTATKKIGNAVVRNRAKRRLREAARLLLPLHGRAGSDYVFIARARTVSRPWPALLDDMESALISLARRKGGPTSGPAHARRHRPDKDETAHG
jgi:ribonuclease P protein component